MQRVRQEGAIFLDISWGTCTAERRVGADGPAKRQVYHTIQLRPRSPPKEGPQDCRRLFPTRRFLICDKPHHLQPAPQPAEKSFRIWQAPLDFGRKTQQAADNEAKFLV